MFFSFFLFFWYWLPNFCKLLFQTKIIFFFLLPQIENEDRLRRYIAYLVWVLLILNDQNPFKVSGEKEEKKAEEER